MGENSEITAKPRGVPFKEGKSGNPNGRPKGQRNYKTIQREALMKIGESRNMTLEEVEQTIQEVGLLKAMKGDYNFYRDYMDREHGKVPEKNINVNVQVEPTDRIKELADKLNS